jgi:antitoxin VapB
MPLYLKDPVVEELADKLASLKKTSKVEAVRQALQAAFEKEQAEPSLIEIGIGFCRDLRARGDVNQGKPADKRFRDSLYE